MSAKTVQVEQVENPCQSCGGPQIGKMHLDSYGHAEMLVVRCLKCRTEKRLYASRREPRFRRGLVDSLGIADRLRRKGWI